MIHIHNGDVVAEAARRSSIPGEHAAFREALATGPATRDLEMRARFLAASHGEANPLKVRNELLDQQHRLERAASDEVVLWFEHDLFCLVNLISLLDLLEQAAELYIVWSPEPLGNADLPALFAARARVSDEMRRLGCEAWRAYASPDPRALEPLFASEIASFPFLADGLMLHARRFPSAKNGLGVVEQRLLDGLLDGPLTFGGLFERFDPEPPRLGLGDAEVLRVLRQLCDEPAPLVQATGEWSRPPELRLRLTEEGERVGRGDADALAIRPSEMWLGGVHVTAQNVWRWDETTRAIIPSRPAG